MRQVRPADPHIPSLAAAREGTRVVELAHHTDTADLVVEAKCCQACDAPVEITQPHLRAIVRRPTAQGSPIFDRPVFCGSRCYARWARNGVRP